MRSKEIREEGRGEEEGVKERTERGGERGGEGREGGGGEGDSISVYTTTVTFEKRIR